jgi:hypothetical protein
VHAFDNPSSQDAKAATKRQPAAGNRSTPDKEIHHACLRCRSRPLFGLDFVIVIANDETGTSYSSQVYPDANNPALRTAELPTQYYFQPARVYGCVRCLDPLNVSLNVPQVKPARLTRTSRTCPHDPMVGLAMRAQHARPVLIKLGGSGVFSRGGSR